MRWTLIALVLTLLGLCRVLPADEAERPYGIEKRIPWTTSKIKGTPDPPAPYRIERVYPALRFDEPLSLALAPGTDRMFVQERFGGVWSFADRPETRKAEPVMHLGRVIYGLALHPRFPENGFLYLTNIVGDEDNERGTRVSRFVVDRDSYRSDPASETVLIEWPSGGHNGGCLKFGPDGYLYISAGDASGIADERLTGQDLSDLPGSVLRIDVDRPGEGAAYGIPADNPFVDVGGARPEVWAYGLRQVWKMSFDRATGELWGGNVGQDLWEMVHILERGGNYGWSVTEGSHPFRPERPRGPSPIIPPLVEHDHTVARSVTGGFVYRGSRLEELAGTYVYGDYDTGRVWGLRYEDAKVTSHRELVRTSLRLIDFAERRDGDLYLLDHMGGGIHRLAPNDPAALSGSGGDFPRSLSRTGLFSSTKDHRPAPGVIPYSINSPMWADGAHKERFLAVPGDARVEFDALLYPQPAPGAPPGWKFPDGTVLVETISLALEAGNPASRRRLETRILHHKRLEGTEEVGDQLWQGYTYVWNDEQTDARLLENPSGLDRAFTITDADVPGGQRQQTWHFPSRAECSVCHNMAAKYVLGVNTLQMNRDHDYGGVADNQLRTMEHLGLFTVPLPARPAELPRLVHSADSTAGLDERARSYLHANCSHCHRKWGGGNAEFQLVQPLPLAATGTLDVRPGQGAFHILDARLIAPGAPDRSVLTYRMATLGSGRMPRLGSGVVDERGLDLIYRWIGAMAPLGEPPAVARQRAEVESALERLRTRGATSPMDAAAIDRSLESTSGAMRLARAIDEGALDDTTRQAIISRATDGAEPHIRDLFERYLPEEKRTRRLGTAIEPATILALSGEAARGERLFLEAAGVQCRNCHRIGDMGSEVGPDLSRIGGKLDRAALLESILEPSKSIEAKYLTYLLQTTGGSTHVGLLAEKGAKEVTLKEAQDRIVRVPAGEVELLVPQPQSLMPELLLRDMTAQEVADLVAYLHSLR
jgi:uncharacterized repeat protein (TIGR03806 family)